jgi:hypothetical protein
MAHEISDEHDGRGVLITLSGDIKADEIYALNEQLMSRERFAGYRYQMWDFRAIGRLELTLDDLRNFAIQDSQASRKSPGQKVALIGRPDPQHLDLASLFHVFEKVWSGYASRTFLDIEAARRWARG